MIKIISVFKYIIIMFKRQAHNQSFLEGVLYLAWSTTQMKWGLLIVSYCEKHNQHAQHASAKKSECIPIGNF